MTHPDRIAGIRAGLERYTARWYETMHVVDVATWLRNWVDVPMIEVWAEAMAAKRTSRDPWALAHAAKIAQAAYIALEPDETRRVLADPLVAALVESLVAERGGDPPYNREGGAS